MENDNSDKKVEEQPKKSKYRAVRVTVFVLFNIFVVGGTAYSEFFKKGSHEAIHAPEFGLKTAFLIPALLCFAAAVLCEVTKYMLLMKKTCGTTNLRHAIELFVLGKYYDSITPSGIGGQPYQIYYLKKKGYSSGACSAIPLSSFMTGQFAFVIIALTVFFVDKTMIREEAMKIAAYVGLFFYALLPTLIVLFSIAPRVMGNILTFFVRLLGKIRIFKNPQKTGEKILTSLSEHKNTFDLMVSDKLLCIEIMVLSMLFQLCICTVPYFVLLAFGPGMTWLEALSSTMLIYAAITFIPTPGNTGAAEASFYLFFRRHAMGGAFWAMLSWRFLTYYIYIIGGLSIYVSKMIGKKRNKKRAKLPPV